MHLRFKYIFLLCFLCTICLPLSGEENPQEYYINEAIEQRDFSQQDWLEAKEGIDFSSDIRKERKKEKDKDEARENNRNRNNPPSITFGDGTAAMILKFLIILGAAVAILLIIRGLLGLGSLPRNKKINAQQAEVISIEKIEENIHESDLEKYIRQALSNEDYSLVIRLYYLAALKELSLQKNITWKKDKTNRHYLNEMSIHPNFNEFKTITYIFERTIYGDAPMDKAAFNLAETRFKSFLNQINSTKV